MSDADDGRPLGREMIENARGYRVPGSIPRNKMWTAIAAELPDRVATESGPRRGSSLRRPWIRSVSWLAAASVALAVGIGIGRQTAGVPTTVPTSAELSRFNEGAVSRAENSSVRVDSRRAAARQVRALEPLLSMVASDARTGRFDPSVGPWAERMLVRTRVLQDGASDDLTLKELLDDLELVLIQIAGLGEIREGRGQDELRLIVHGLAQNNMMARLRAMTALGP